jgi:hypothetical protein
MNDTDDWDVEGLLRSARLKPAPPGLREKVLEAAAKHKEETAWTTPRLRWCLAGCTVVLAVIFIMDAGLSRRQQNRLQAFLDGSRLTQNQAGDESRVLAEVLGADVNRKLLARNDLSVAQQIKAEQLRREDILKELLEEDFDGSESEKNSH